MVPRYARAVQVTSEGEKMELEGNHEHPSKLQSASPNDWLE